LTTTITSALPVEGQELKHLGQGAFAFSVATRLMTANEVEIQGQQVRVRRTSSKSLSMLTFTMVGRQFAAIEQNPTKPSRWGPLAAARAQSGCRSSLMNLRVSSHRSKVVRSRWGRELSFGITDRIAYQRRHLNEMTRDALIAH
jgi:hypothetical protein